MHPSCVFAICMVGEACPTVANVVRPIVSGVLPSCSPQAGEYGDLWRTNLHIWQTAPAQCERVLVLESDARPDAEFYRRLDLLPSRDIIWLDDRTAPSTHKPSGCCTVGMVYSRTILPLLVREFTGTASGYANNYAPRPINPDPLCLFDWFLGNLADVRKIKSASVHLLHHA
jgi:hypothetical protein